MPSPSPTKINYYIVGPATDPPTLYDGNGNVYANNGPIHERALGYVMENVLYSSIAGGVLVCCCLIVCIKCCKQRKNKKKLAPQAKQRRFVQKKKNGVAAVYQSPQHQSVPSKSMMFPRSKSALDQPICASNNFTPGANTNDSANDHAQPAFSELLDNDNPLNLHVIGDDDGTNPLIDDDEDEYVGIEDEDRVDNEVVSDDDNMVCIQ